MDASIATGRGGMECSAADTRKPWGLGQSRGLLAGKTLASAWGDKTVKLWDAGSGALQQTLEGHLGSVNSVQHSSFQPCACVGGSAG
jgi:WD40 repeat protein